MANSTNCIAHWYPKLQASGVCFRPSSSSSSPISVRTIWVRGVGWDGFLNQLASATERMAFPCFLRTGHGSEKHEWRSTCCVSFPGDLGTHVQRTCGCGAFSKSRCGCAGFGASSSRDGVTAGGPASQTSNCRGTA
jgi:hypothetical protein